MLDDLLEWYNMTSLLLINICYYLLSYYVYIILLVVVYGQYYFEFHCSILIYISFLRDCRGWKLRL